MTGAQWSLTGQWSFNELSFETGQSMASVRALTYCDLHVIKRTQLREVLDF